MTIFRPKIKLPISISKSRTCSLIRKCPILVSVRPRPKSKIQQKKLILRVLMILWSCFLQNLQKFKISLAVEDNFSENNTFFFSSKFYCGSFSADWPNVSSATGQKYSSSRRRFQHRRDSSHPEKCSGKAQSGR
jgi:hypothetical protein